MRIISAIINLVPIYVLTFRENIPYIVTCFLLVRFHLPIPTTTFWNCYSRFCHSVNGASQKQEFWQRASEPASQRDRETKTYTKQLASGEIEKLFLIPNNCFFRAATISNQLPISLPCLFLSKYLFLCLLFSFVYYSIYLFLLFLILFFYLLCYTTLRRKISARHNKDGTPL